MGKQSARLYYQGKDHKDIFYQGNFHDKMYKGSQLLWEKLYPEAYFIATRNLEYKYRNVTEIISEAGIDDKAQIPWDRNIENPKSYDIVDFCSKAILCRFLHSYGYCFTVDGRHFRRVPQLEYPVYAIGDGFCKISGNKITIVQIKNDLSYDVSEFENNLVSESENIFRCVYTGNYLLRGISQNIKNRVATIEWLTVDANGNFTNHINTYNIDNEDEAIRYGNDYSLYAEDSFSVVMGNYVYWCVPGASFLGGGTIYLSRSAKIMCRNLSTFTDTVLIDMEEISTSLCFRYYSNSLYISTKKAVYLGVLQRDFGGDRHSIVVSVGDEGASIKRVQDMKIRVLGEDRYVNIVTDLNGSRSISVNEIVLDAEQSSYIYVSGGLPTMHNGVYEPDAINGMAFPFSYGNTNANPWYVMGYMYIDNFDFTESENNYIYITKEYVDGELVINR